VTGLSDVLFVSSPSGGSAEGAISPARVLEVLREIYGAELAPVLLAIGQVESGLDVLAVNDTTRESSYGIWQVNRDFWGPDAAPSSIAVAGDADRLLQWQARAMRPVVEDAIAGARELATLAGAPFAPAINLIWQYGRTAARRIVTGIRWSRDAVAARIAELYSATAAALYLARDAAFAAFLAILSPVIFAGGMTLVGLVLLLFIAVSEGFKVYRGRA